MAASSYRGSSRTNNLLAHGKGTCVDAKVRTESDLGVGIFEPRIECLPGTVSGRLSRLQNDIDTVGRW